MKKDIIISGVGGQGIISIAAGIGIAAVKQDLNIKQSEVHGMSQRGGEVQSHLRISDSEIASDLIPFGRADIIISLEPMEALRYLVYLDEDGWIISNTKPFINISNYPNQEEIISQIKSFGNHVLIDADKIAREISSPKSANMVILGASLPFLDLEESSIEYAITTLFSSKGLNVVEKNILAVKMGLDHTMNCLSPNLI